MTMKTSSIKVILLFALCIVSFPALGIMLQGKELRTYLEFPPKTQHIVHALFSLPIFCILLLCISTALFPFITRIFNVLSVSLPPKKRAPLPFLRYFTLFLLLFFWTVTWTRVSLFKSLQAHTFTPLWVSYIAFMNVVVYERDRKSPFTRSPKKFLILFPVSAVMWWLFEYLNRFVQNWRYENIQTFSAGEYFSFSSLAFSTVLPAVLITEEWISGSSRIQSAFQNWIRLEMHCPKLVARVMLTIGNLTLLTIGIWPNVCFPLLWISPLLIVSSLKFLFGRTSLVFELTYGNWYRAVCWGLAALVCGILWETWNYYSFARWVYQVPCVGRFFIFEMPLLGFAGYLPFGLICGEIVGLVFEQQKDLPIGMEKEDTCWLLLSARRLCSP